MYKLYSGNKMIEERNSRKNNKQFIMQKSEISVSQDPKRRRRDFVITKKIAKHGSQAIIIIPRILESELSPGTIVEVKLNVLGSEK